MKQDGYSSIYLTEAPIFFVLQRPHCWTSQRWHPKKDRMILELYSSSDASGATTLDYQLAASSRNGFRNRLLFPFFVGGILVGSVGSKRLHRTR